MSLWCTMESDSVYDCLTYTCVLAHETKVAVTVLFFLAEANAIIFADVLQLFPSILHNA